MPKRSSSVKRGSSRKKMIRRSSGSKRIPVMGTPGTQFRKIVAVYQMAKDNFTRTSTSSSQPWILFPFKYPCMLAPPIVTSLVGPKDSYVYYHSKYAGAQLATLGEYSISQVKVSIMLNTQILSPVVYTTYNTEQIRRTLSQLDNTFYFSVQKNTQMLDQSVNSGLRIWNNVTTNGRLIQMSWKNKYNEAYGLQTKQPLSAPISSYDYMGVTLNPADVVDTGCLAVKVENADKMEEKDKVFFRVQWTVRSKNINSPVLDRFVVKGDHQDIANQINSLYKEDILINEYKDIYAINGQFQEKRKKILEELKKKQEVEKGMNMMRI